MLYLYFPLWQISTTRMHLDHPGSLCLGETEAWPKPFFETDIWHPCPGRSAHFLLLQGCVAGIKFHHVCTSTINNKNKNPISSNAPRHSAAAHEKRHGDAGESSNRSSSRRQYLFLLPPSQKIHVILAFKFCLKKYVIVELDITFSMGHTN